MPINVPQLNPQLLAGAAPQGLGELMPSFLGGMETQRKAQQQQATNVVNEQTIRLKLKQIASLAQEEGAKADFKKFLVGLGPDWMSDPKAVRQARAKWLEIHGTKPPFDALAAAEVEEKIAMINPALGEEALGSLQWVTPNGSDHKNLAAQGFIEHDYKIPEKEEPGKVVTYIDPGVADPRTSAEGVREGSAAEDAKIAAGWVPWTYKMGEQEVKEQIALINPESENPIGTLEWVAPDSTRHGELAGRGYIEYDYKIPETDDELGKPVTYVNPKADDPQLTAKAVRADSDAETALINEGWVPWTYKITEDKPGDTVTYIDPSHADPRSTAKSVRKGSTEETAMLDKGWVRWTYKMPTEPKGLQQRYVFDIVENKVIEDFSSTDTEMITKWNKKKKEDRLADGSQRYFTVPSPGGAATLSEGYGFESVASRDRALVQERSMNQAASMAREVLQNIDEGPWRAGIVATAKAILQEFGRISGDISKYVSAPSMRKFNVNTQRWVGDLREPDGTEVMSKGLIQEFFDPKLSLTELYENAMAIRWARYQYPTGRLLKEMVHDAKDATKISGFTSVQAVIERYEFMAEVFEDQANWLGDQRKQKQPAADAPDADTNVIETRRYDSEGNRIDTPTEVPKTFASVVNQASESDLLTIKRTLESLEPTRDNLRDLELVEARLAQLGVTP